MHNLRIAYAATIVDLEDAHNHFCSLVPAPQRTKLDTGYTFRYVEKTVEQAVIIKMARTITGLRAAAHLLEIGFLQEAALIQRNLDELQEDTLFLVYGQLVSGLTKEHERYLEGFWSDHFESRTSLPRPRIRDYLAATEARMGVAETGEINSPMKSVYAMYSGYAHAASAHAMELFDGAPPRWQLKGNLGSSLQAAHWIDLKNQFYRAATAFGMAALIFKRPLIYQKLLVVASKLADGN